MLRKILISMSVAIVAIIGLGSWTSPADAWKVTPRAWTECRGGLVAINGTFANTEPKGKEFVMSVTMTVGKWTTPGHIVKPDGKPEPFWINTRTTSLPAGSATFTAVWANHPTIKVHVETVPYGAKDCKPQPPPTTTPPTTAPPTTPPTTTPPSMVAPNGTVGVDCDGLATFTLDNGDSNVAVTYSLYLGEKLIKTVDVRSGTASIQRVPGVKPGQQVSMSAAEFEASATFPTEGCTKLIPPKKVTHQEAPTPSKPTPAQAQVTTELPKTGDEVLPLGLAGLGLMCAGGLALLARHKHA